MMPDAIETSVAIRRSRCFWAKETCPHVELDEHVQVRVGFGVTPRAGPEDREVEADSRQFGEQPLVHSDKAAFSLGNVRECAHAPPILAQSRRSRASQGLALATRSR